MKSKKWFRVPSKVEIRLELLREGFQMSGNEVRRNRLQILFIFFVLVSGAMIMACKITALQPNLSIDPEPTPKSTIMTGSISGTVWHDLCESSFEEENPDPRCVFDAPSDLYPANGIFEAGEPEPTFTTTPQPTCSNKATFIEDVTVHDGARFSRDEEFSKVWRLKNVGTCEWSTEYSLVFVSGDQMSGLAALLITEEVPPGSEIDLGVSLKAPEKDGSYKGYWMLQSDSGEVFSIGKSADKPFWVRITVGKVVTRDSVISWTYELNPENLADEGRWVDVDLGQQLLTAYEGSTPIMRFVVSTGTAAHPTVTGQFRIWVKLASTDMSGPGYSLEDVPYTMYFYQGYGLHGTYWHDNFGTPMSHGCVNLRTPDAGWLFDFVSEGTLVNVHL